jgi:hypothetical protein
MSASILWLPHAQGQSPAANQPAQSTRPIELNLAPNFAPNADFEALIREWFGPATARLSLHYATWTKNDILAPKGDSDALRIWVEVTRPSLVRLYFADASGHYYLRDVPLHTGLDEVGRENLAQVIVTSAVAFMQQRVSTNIRDIEQALETPATAAVPGTTQREATAAAASPASEASPWTFRAGGFYGAALEQSNELRHGPGALVGLARKSARRRLTLNAQVQYCWPETIEGPDAVLSVHTLSLRSTFGLDRTFGESASIGVQLGAGADDVRVNPRRLTQSAATPRSVTLLRPAMMLSVRTSLIQSNAQWALLIGANIYFSHTHYDVIDNGAPTIEYAPYLVQPQIAFESSWR